MSWTASLDDEPPPPLPPNGSGAPGPGSGNGVPKLVAAVVLIALAVLVVPRFAGTQERPAPPRPVLGARLAVPLQLAVPPGAVVTSDSRYVGLQLPGSGAVLVTVPDQVAEGRGVRSPMPADPASWLRGRSDVYVSRVRVVQVAGLPATQVDYRRSDAARPQSRFARMSLFCSTTCTQITSGARVRATFLAVAGRTVLVEAVWAAGADPWGRNRQMPSGLRTAYDALLAGTVDSRR